MKSINSLNDLLIAELADLINVEDQLVAALPKMVESSQSLTLKAILEDHMEDTKIQADRLRGIFNDTGQSLPKLTCKPMKELIEEGEHTIKKIEKCPARDAVIIRMAQRMKEYEIGSYQTAWEHAANLEHNRTTELLDKTLYEERVMKLHLNEIAQGIINTQATDPGVSSSPLD